MLDFDKTLMNDKGMVLPPALETMSGRMYDALVNNYQAANRGWTPLERMGNQMIAWYPWGVIKRHLMNPLVWGDAPDKNIWTAITETKNHRAGYHSFMIKVINKDCVMIKATPRNGIPPNWSDKGGAGSGGRPSEDGSDRGKPGGKDKGNDGKGKGHT
eukprot:15282867-Heterocapsa_arctica.AAC.1